MCRYAVYSFEAGNINPPRWNYTQPMGIVQKLKRVVRENDFVEIRKSKDGTTSWFRKVSSNMRLCIDDLTNSGPFFGRQVPLS